MSATPDCRIVELNSIIPVTHESDGGWRDMDKLAFAYQDLKQPSRDESWGEGYWAGIDFSKSYFESLLTREREVAREEMVSKMIDYVRRRYNERYSHPTREYTPTDHFRDDILNNLSDLIEKMGGDK